MRRFSLLFTAAVAASMFGLSGCASVATQRAKDVSSAGVAYSQATAAVLDIAIDATVDASSQSRILGKPRQPVTDAAERQSRQAELKEIDKELIGNATDYVRLKRSVGAIGAYFKALQELADGSPAEATETAVSGLADRVNGLNAALDKGKDGRPLVSDAEKGAIAGLAKQVAKQIHGAALAKALERDASVIGRALVLQEKVLKAAEMDIRANLTNASQRFYTGRVLVPYGAGAIDDAWADDRRAYIRVAALGNTPEALNTAQAASRQMATVWARVLSGEHSAKEITAMLKDTEDLLAAVAALKDAVKK
jgi:uncharacterized protein YceK